MRSESIVISGYYGFGNAGDEAILQATIAGIRQHVPQADITVLSSDPAVTAAATGVRSLHRYRLRDLLCCMKPGGLLISGGGGLFQDVTSRRSLLYYLGILRLARARGMKTMVYAQGVGPLYQASSRAMVRAVLARVNCITVRDRGSADLLGLMGLSATVIADPAFALAPAPRGRDRTILTAAGVPGDQPIIAVALRPWAAFTNDARTAVAWALGRQAAAHSAHIVLIDMHPSADGVESAALAQTLGGICTRLDGPYSPEEIAAVLGISTAVVAMRLHAIILASLSGIPSVALSYDPKVTVVCGQLGLPPALDVRTLDAPAIDRALDAAFQLDAPGRDAIRQAAAVQQHGAEQGFHIIQDLLT